MVFRTVIAQVVSKRVPLIKFRKGGHDTSFTPDSRGTNQTSKLFSSNAIEDWELPRRFARKPISLEEMEYINCGGPA